MKGSELYDYLKNTGVLQLRRYKSFEIDYHNFSYPSMSLEDRKKFNIGGIYLNAAKCKKCGWIIRSKNKHDYKECQCGAIAVDGGSWYARRTGNPNDMEDIIIPFEVQEE